MKPLSQVQAMTEEEKQVRIAELCGWKMLPKTHWLHRKGKNDILPTGERDGGVNVVPDYVGDLGAMHEAELFAFGIMDDCPIRGKLPFSHWITWDSSKRHDLRNAYVSELEQIVSGGVQEFTSQPGMLSLNACFATAAQRATAFLCVMDE